MMKRKGQYTIIEQVILFAIGISITIGFLFAFKDLSSNVQDDMKDTQSELIAEYVASTSVDLIESGAEGRMEMPVPVEIAGGQYAVRMDQGAVRVEVAGNQEVTSLYGLGSRVNVRGSARGTDGALSVTLEGNELELAGAK